MKLFSLLFLSSFLFSQHIKEYTFSFADLESKKVSFIAPKGSNMSVSPSTDGNFSIKMSIEVPEKYEEFFKTLPEKPTVRSLEGDLHTIEFEFVLEALSKRSHGLIPKFIGRIRDGETTINGVRYYAKEGKQYEVLSHFITLELQVPNLNHFYIKHRYGQFDLNNIKSNSFELNAYESDVVIKNLTAHTAITNKYNNTQLSNIEGDLECSLYESTSEINGISGDINLTNKYRPTVLRSVSGNATVKLYESDATIDGIKKTLRLENKYKPTSVSNIQSDLVATFYESNVTIENVSGNLKLENKYDPTIVTNIGGNASIKLYESRAKIKGVTGELSGAMKYEPISIVGLAGDVELELYESPLTLESSGNVSLNTKYGDVTITGSPQNIDITGYEANLLFELSSQFSKDIEVHNKYGDITIEDIALKNFRLHAKSKEGKILIPELDTDKDEKDVKFQWYQKDLPSISIDAYDGKIRIK